MPARRARLLLPLALLSVMLMGSRCMHLREPDPRSVGLRGAGCAVDITPVVGVNHSDPIYMAGFGQNRDAQGVRDPIWARGVVLEQGDTKLALVTLDVVGYFYNEVQTIRALVDPARGFDSIVGLQHPQPRRPGHHGSLGRRTSSTQRCGSHSTSTS